MKRTTKRQLGLAGSAVAGLLVLLLVACARIHVMFTTVPAMPNVAPGVLPKIVALDAGCVKLVWPFKPSKDRARWISSVVDSERFLFQWIPDFSKNIVSGFYSIRLPIWIPSLLIAIPSFLLWWRNRRLPEEDHCDCGYDLTGNVSGVCPECGTSSLEIPDTLGREKELLRHDE